MHYPRSIGPTSKTKKKGRVRIHGNLLRDASDVDTVCSVSNCFIGARVPSFAALWTQEPKSTPWKPPVAMPHQVKEDLYTKKDELSFPLFSFLYQVHIEALFSINNTL